MFWLPWVAAWLLVGYLSSAFVGKQVRGENRYDASDVTPILLFTLGGLLSVIVALFVLREVLSDGDFESIGFKFR